MVATLFTVHHKPEQDSGAGGEGTILAMHVSTQPLQKTFIVLCSGDNDRKSYIKDVEGEIERDEM